MSSSTLLTSIIMANVHRSEEKIKLGVALLTDVVQLGAEAEDEKDPQRQQHLENLGKKIHAKDLGEE